MPVLKENRLPIHHPDYRYPPSINPYWEKLKMIQGSVYSDNETEKFRGQWRSCFKEVPNAASAKLHVEIGCNAGHVIVEWAKAHPEDLFIGIDWKFKPIFRGAEKAARRNLKNLIFLRAHAERLPYMFGPGEIDRLYLFFPDPWQKKAQLKNRFVTSERLHEIAKVIKPDGIFHIKTDHRGYFEWMLQAIEKASQSWKVLETSWNLHENHPAPETLTIPEVTLFERLFIKDQLPIHSVKLNVKPLLQT